MATRQCLKLYKNQDAGRYSSAESQFFNTWIPPPHLVKAIHHTPRIDGRSSKSVASKFAKRWTHSNAAKQEEEGEEEEKSRPDSSPGLSQDKQNLLSLVDQIQGSTVDEHLHFIRDPYMRGYAQADGPELAVSERTEDKNFPSFHEVRTGDDSVQRIVALLWRTIQRRLRNPYKTDIESIYHIYQSLPSPRMPYLHSKVRHAFMRVLGREKRENRSMMRYFEVVADIQKSGLRLTLPEWNHALSLAGRYVGHTTSTEATAVMKLWQEMESDVGIKGNGVTFNILFDVASKAGNFVLSEMLYKEMEKRGYKYNRYHHVSLIHLFGLKMDSDGIRAAYKEMVEAGEIIDTTVLNCVIAGFLRCGEEYAAERVYERMKAAHKRAPSMPYRNYLNDKIITKVLMMFAKVSQNTEDLTLRRHFQKVSPIVPDIQTYRILLNHYAVRISALDKVANFLDDMKWFKIPLHGCVFLAMFKGFAIHGSNDGQAWSAPRLEKVYAAFQTALKENANGLYVDVWMVKWLLKAFQRCESEERVWEVWAELRPRCEIDFEPDDVEHFEEFLIDLFKNDKKNSRYRDRGMFGLME